MPPFTGTATLTASLTTDDEYYSIGVTNNVVCSTDTSQYHILASRNSVMLLIAMEIYNAKL